MKTSIILVFILAVMAIACDKDRFQTVPQLKLKSRNTDIVPNGGTLELTIEFTDKEGDVTDSIIFVRERLNRKSSLRTAPSSYPLPSYPKMDKGEFELALEYQRHLVTAIGRIPIPGTNPTKYEVDTMLVKIVARDKAGNKSDTLIVENVYVIR